jgi:hypothetical protein
MAKIIELDLVRRYDITEAAGVLEKNWSDTRAAVLSYIKTPEDKAGAALELLADNIPEGRGCDMGAGRVCVCTGGAVDFQRVRLRLIKICYLAGFNTLDEFNLLEGARFHLY